MKPGQTGMGSDIKIGSTFRMILVPIFTLILYVHPVWCTVRTFGIKKSWSGIQFHIFLHFIKMSWESGGLECWVHFAWCFLYNQIQWVPGSGLHRHYFRGQFMIVSIPFLAAELLMHSQFLELFGGTKHGVVCTRTPNTSYGCEKSWTFPWDIIRPVISYIALWICFTQWIGLYGFLPTGNSVFLPIKYRLVPCCPPSFSGHLQLAREKSRTETLDDGSPVRLVHLRNPWGHKEWNGILARQQYLHPNEKTRSDRDRGR